MALGSAPIALIGPGRTWGRNSSVRALIKSSSRNRCSNMVGRSRLLSIYTPNSHLDVADSRFPKQAPGNAIVISVQDPRLSPLISASHRGSSSQQPAVIVTSPLPCPLSSLSAAPAMCDHIFTWCYKAAQRRCPSPFHGTYSDPSRISQAPLSKLLATNRIRSTSILMKRDGW